MQVVNDFGPLSNAELLRRYGFVETAENLHDCVELSVEDILQSVPVPILASAWERMLAHQLSRCQTPSADMAGCQMRCFPSTMFKASLMPPIALPNDITGT